MYYFQQVTSRLILIVTTDSDHHVRVLVSNSFDCAATDVLCLCHTHKTVGNTRWGKGRAGMGVLMADGGWGGVAELGGGGHALGAVPHRSYYKGKSTHHHHRIKRRGLLMN